MNIFNIQENRALRNLIEENRKKELEAFMI